MRALNIDGGEGSGVKGHTTEHAVRLTEGKLGQSEYNRLFALARAKGLGADHLNAQLKAQGIKLHPDTLVQVESHLSAESNNRAGKIGPDNRSGRGETFAGRAPNMSEISRRLREGDY
jgi:hypothetical protein